MCVVILSIQAHESSVRAMRWSHNDQWMITADHAGFIKYWQSNMNNVKMYQGHKEPIRSLRWDFAPSSGCLQIGSKIKQCSCINVIQKIAEAYYNTALGVLNVMYFIFCGVQKYLYLTKYALLFHPLIMQFIRKCFNIMSLVRLALGQDYEWINMKIIDTLIKFSLVFQPQYELSFGKCIYWMCLNSVTLSKLQKYLYLTNYSLLFIAPLSWFFQLSLGSSSHLI